MERGDQAGGSHPISTMPVYTPCDGCGHVRARGVSDADRRPAGARQVDLGDAVRRSRAGPVAGHRTFAPRPSLLHTRGRARPPRRRSGGGGGAVPLPRLHSGPRATAFSRRVPAPLRSCYGAHCGTPARGWGAPRRRRDSSAAGAKPLCHNGMIS